MQRDPKWLRILMTTLLLNAYAKGIPRQSLQNTLRDLFLYTLKMIEVFQYPIKFSYKL